MAEDAGRGPCGDRERTGGAGARDERGARAQPRVAKCPGRERERRERRDGGAQRGRAGREEVGKRLRAWQGDGACVDERDAQRGEKAAHGRHGGDGEHEQHDQRLEVPGAEARQRAARAAAGIGHAHAEQRATGEVAEPEQSRAGVERAREVDRPGDVQRLRARDRDRRGKGPGAQPCRVAEPGPVAHGAHGAEPAALGRRAEGDADGEPGERQQGGVELHPIPQVVAAGFAAPALCVIGPAGARRQSAAPARRTEGIAWRRNWT